MIILACGCRDWTDARAIGRELERIEVQEPVHEFRLIHGKSRGADVLAWAEARALGWIVEGYAADWLARGKAAGPIRNQRMLDEGKPDLVLAFWDGKSTGTLDMIKRATQAGVPVRIVPKGEE